MKKGIKIVLIVLGVLVGLPILLTVIVSLLPEDKVSGNAISDSNKPSTSEPAVSEESINTTSESNKPSASEAAVSEETVGAGKPAPAEDFMYKLSAFKFYGDGEGGVSITDYKGSAKNLIIPATIEEVPVISVSVKDIKCEQIFVTEGITDVAFPNAKNLRAISLPSTLEVIYSFEECIMLTSVSIPFGVDSIYNFQKSGLRSIVIPASVSFLGKFHNSKDLISAEISGDNLKWDSSFLNCEALQTVIIHGGVPNIGKEAFRNCKSLKNLTLPNSLRTIEDEAFRACSSLTSVVIPNGVRSIGEGAFRDCTNLSSISIPKSVTEIHKDAFRDCKNLITVDIEEDTNLHGASGVFKSLPKLNLKSKAAIQKANGGYF